MELPLRKDLMLRIRLNLPKRTHMVKAARKHKPEIRIPLLHALHLKDRLRGPSSSRRISTQTA